MKSSPFAARFTPGTVLGAWRGWQVADHYGDPEAEAGAVRQAAGLIDRSWRARVEVRGRDRASFLHAMLTNDVKALQPGQGCQAAFLTAHGKVCAFLRVYAGADTLVLELDDDTRARALETLDHFLISERAEFGDLGDAWTTLSVEGPRAREVLGALGMAALPEDPLGHQDRDLSGITLRVVRAAESGEVGFDLWVPREAALTAWERLLEAGGPWGLRPVGLAPLNALRVEAGVPWYGIDATEETLLLELPSESMVSFNKGCYVGQEVVARITSRGHVNRKLTGLVFAGSAIPPAGAKVLGEGREVGRITSPVFSPTLKRGVALAFVRREWWEPGTCLEARSDGSTMAAEVAALPFYRRRD